jgi:hypothetical protein
MSKRSLFSLRGVLVLLASATPAMTAPEEEWQPPVVLSDWQASVIDWRLEVGEDGTLAAFWLAHSTGQWALWARVRPVLAENPIRTRIRGIKLNNPSEASR